MPGAYSEDLRKRALSKYQSGLSTHKVAELLDVSHDFVSDLVKRFNETGSIKANKIGGSKKPFILDENLTWIKEKLIEKNDLRVKDIQELFVLEKGLHFNEWTIKSAIKRLNFSLKKRCFLQ